jgi:myo-inositol-1(or 4)-monophosphatase
MGNIVQSEELERRARIGLAAVREAGELAASSYRRRSELSVEAKGEQDLVSEADRACEDLIVQRLTKEFPQDSFIGEERGVIERGPATWVIDPIDGTANFLRGISHWCVSIGLVVDRKAMIGFVFDPIAGELFSAVSGKGAFLNGQPIKVSGETDIRRARVGLGFSYRRPVAPHAHDVEVLLDARCEYSRLGSGALGMAYVAAGRFDGYWERHINAWDVAAGLAIVVEAGGRTNDFFAGDAMKVGNEVLAVTPALFGPLSDLIGR